MTKVDGMNISSSRLITLFWEERAGYLADQLPRLGKRELGIKQINYLGWGRESWVLSRSITSVGEERAGYLADQLPRLGKRELGI